MSSSLRGPKSRSGDAPASASSYSTEPSSMQSAPLPSSITTRCRSIGSESRTAAIRGANSRVVHQRDEVGVVEEVAQLVLDVAVVDVDRDRAQLVGGEHRLDELEAVEA